MNAETFTHHLPSAAELAGMDDATQSHHAREFIAAIVAAIVAEGREPTGWEASNLDVALNGILLEQYQGAIDYAKNVFLPVGQGRPDWNEGGVWDSPLRVMEFRERQAILDRNWRDEIAYAKHLQEQEQEQARQKARQALA